ncbi:MAG TPA: Crp/Fnr family transcriptional regulator [Bacteroidales bacterium]|nr:Crp/Fnr family transcriptional regulator [Bacteroidales bacterium]HPT10983.1 Crp/Fnr family transcriptional regulator [Bacteroidales bacterium]
MTYKSVITRFDDIIDQLRGDDANAEKFKDLLTEKEIAVKTILLHEGEVATRLYFIRKGCLRLWFNKDGKDITLQFFFDGQAVASMESFFSNRPSMFTLESIEPTTVISLTRENFELLQHTFPEMKEGFQDILFQRLRNYTQLFLSRIKDTPRERYDDLVKNHPEIIKRVPQHYIASYLGITPISLSRIRNRK